jgi:hypothetical protein
VLGYTVEYLFLLELVCAQVVPHYGLNKISKYIYLIRFFEPILKVSHDGVLHLEKLFLDFIHRLMFLKTQRVGNCICFRHQVK